MLKGDRNDLGSLPDKHIGICGRALTYNFESKSPSHFTGKHKDGTGSGPSYRYRNCCADPPPLDLLALRSCSVK